MFRQWIKFVHSICLRHVTTLGIMGLQNRCTWWNNRNSFDMSWSKLFITWTILHIILVTLFLYCYFITTVRWILNLNFLPSNADSFHSSLGRKCQFPMVFLVSSCLEFEYAFHVIVNNHNGHLLKWRIPEMYTQKYKLFGINDIVTIYYILHQKRLISVTSWS
jgi:hypothetical protein